MRETHTVSRRENPEERMEGDKGRGRRRHRHVVVVTMVGKGKLEKGEAIACWGNNNRPVKEGELVGHKCNVNATNHARK